MTRYHQRFKSDVPVEQWRTMTGSNMRERVADNSFTPHALAVAPLSNDTEVTYTYATDPQHGGSNGAITQSVNNLEIYDNNLPGSVNTHLANFSASRPATAVRLTDDEAYFRVVGIPSGNEGMHLIVAFKNAVDDTTNLARLDENYNLVWQRTVPDVWFYGDGGINMSRGGTKIGVIEWTAGPIKVKSYNASTGTMAEQREINWYDPAYSDWDFRFDDVQVFNGTHACEDYLHIAVDPMRRKTGVGEVNRGRGSLVVNLNDLTEYRLTKFPALLGVFPLESGNGGQNGLVYGYFPDGPYGMVIPAKIVTMWPDGQRSESYEIDTVGGSFGQINIFSISVNHGDGPLEVTEMSYYAWVYSGAITALYSSMYPDEAIVMYNASWSIFDRDIKVTEAPYPYFWNVWGYDIHLWNAGRRDSNT